jgi:hypothetical protein
MDPIWNEDITMRLEDVAKRVTARLQVGSYRWYIRDTCELPV